MRQHFDICPFLEQHEISALLIPHDKQASRIYRWARTMGFSIPDRLSLLSFDNSSDWKHLPVSSVDFGMRRVGYGTAQILLKQVPVSVAPDGTLHNSCYVAKRGSIGRFTGKELSLSDFWV